MWKTVAEDMAPMPVINRGFGGSTMPDLIHYADRVIYPYKPKGILVYEGDNDITSDDTSPEDVLANTKNASQHGTGKIARNAYVVYFRQAIRSP